MRGKYEITLNFPQSLLLGLYTINNATISIIITSTIATGNSGCIKVISSDILSTTAKKITQTIAIKHIRATNKKTFIGLFDPL